MNPHCPVYMAAAKALLMAMQELAGEERDAAGEVAESWPTEMKLFPAGDNTAEGVLYMPRAIPAVYIFQSTARVLDGRTDCEGVSEEEVEVEVASFAALSPNLYGMAQTYRERFDERLFSCSCGHEIPQFLGLDGEDEDQDEEDGVVHERGQLPKTSEDFRRMLLRKPEEQNYVCPACGQKPNR